MAHLLLSPEAANCFEVSRFEIDDAYACDVPVSHAAPSLSDSTCIKLEGGSTKRLRCCCDA
eukprot:1158991-Pelagomonas_calceolata.AAC.7